jgi:hypothetical protein
MAPPPMPGAWPPPYGYPGTAQPGWGARPQDNTGLGAAALVLGALLVLGDVLAAVTSFAAVDAYDAAAARGEDPTLVFTAYDASALLGILLLPAWILGSLWLSRARSNAALLQPMALRRSSVWSWLGWWVPVVSLWFPKQIVDDSWRITSRALPGGGSARSRYRSTGLWWGLWLVYVLLGNGAGQLQASAWFRPDTTSGQVDTHQGVVPALQVVIALAGVAAYAAWFQIVRGLSRAQAELSGSVR